MKYVLIIGDGMADDPIAALGGRTPLEACEKPFFDSLCERGELGLVQTIPEGFPPGSDTAIMSIFGCDLARYFSGRAPLELAASGIDMPAGSAAYRCNMVALGGDEDLPFGENTRSRVQRRLHRGRGERRAHRLALRTAGVRPQGRRGGPHRPPRLLLPPPGGAGGRGHHGHRPGPAARPPGRKNRPHPPRRLRQRRRAAGPDGDGQPPARAPPDKRKAPRGGPSARQRHLVLGRGQGRQAAHFPARFGADGGVVSAVPLCHGIARLVGLEPISVPTATGEWDTDYEAKTRAALDCLRGHDFTAIHLEGPDEATHNHDLEHKIYSVECLSERVAKPLCAGLRSRGDDFRLLILSDHRTFMHNGAHGATPVPYMIYDSRELTPGSGLGYSEANGEKGPFLSSGTELMPRLFQQ